jgi:hypothetical protein
MKQSFTKQDLALFEDIGISSDDVAAQLALLKKGTTASKLLRPATERDGIQVLTQQQMLDYAKLFDQEKSSFSMVRFIPASGLATRMFKFLHYFIDRYNAEKETLRSYLNRKKTYKLAIFLGGLEKFPFYQSIKSQIKELQNGAFQHDYRYLFIQKTETLLSKLPKALIPFHNYKGITRTAAAEQLFFSKEFMISEKTMNIHFTIPPKSTKAFEESLSSSIEEISKSEAIQTHVSYSNQKRSTDSIAVNMDNSLYRNQHGNLFFRAAGHGALIDNLNDLDEAVVFLSNIDNVAVASFHKKAGFYKKILAGVLLSTLKQIYKFSEALERRDFTDLNTIKIFVQDHLNVNVPKNVSDDALQEFLQHKLNRPLRVCGMVKNEGEPGGGPFWVEKSGQTSLQIVESAQVNMSNPDQKDVFKSGTHFNPVDIVCATYDHNGNKYDLKNFVDNDSYFVVEKSLGEAAIKAIERPGLWNGGMADWNTIFVEVPVRTFNPVKTVNDLLRPMHQSI